MRDKNIAENNARFEALGLNKFSATVNSFANASASSTGIREGEQGSRPGDTYDSDYLPETAEQVQGDTDDDTSLDEELVDQPVPLMIIEVPGDVMNTCISYFWQQFIT